MPRKKGFVNFIIPTKWKIIGVAILYFSNLVSVFGFIINMPIYYTFYWGRNIAAIDTSVFFVIHLFYLYFLSCMLTKLLE